jgi:hypothetical protein
MPAYVLFKLTPGSEDSQTIMQAGWPVAVRAINQYGGKQVLPNFGQIIVSDMTVAQVEAAYMRPWHREIDWEFVSHDWAADAHALRVFAAEGVSASLKGAITRDEVESFLNRWGAEVLEIAPNSVTFAATVTDAIKSEGFWGMVPPARVLTETAYDQATGTHTMRILYDGKYFDIVDIAEVGRRERLNIFAKARQV